MKRGILLLPILFLVATGQVHADLIGSTMDWQYYAFGSAYTSPNTFTDNGGVAGNFIGDFKIIADGSSITFDYSSYSGVGSVWSSSALSLAPTIHNGIAINMISGPSFQSVTIDPATNMSGFDASRVSFTSNQIQVDWQNLSFSNTTIVKLDVNASNSDPPNNPDPPPAIVPEPTSLAVFGMTTLTAAAYFGWRRRKQPAQA